MTDWVELIRESKGEWGLKSVLFIGVWIVAPTFGGLKFEFSQTFVLMVIVFAGIIFGNLFYDDFLADK